MLASMSIWEYRGREVVQAHPSFGEGSVHESKKGDRSFLQDLTGTTVHRHRCNPPTRVMVPYPEARVPPLYNIFVACSLHAVCLVVGLLLHHLLGLALLCLQERSNPVEHV